MQATFSHTSLNYLALENNPILKLAKVSRFCVSRDFKRKQKESATLTGSDDQLTEDYIEDERRAFLHITIVLIECLIKMSAEHDIEYWFAVIEPSLPRFLSKLGIHFIEIGSLTDYHGKRQPSLIKINNLLNV
jgi:N-acyl amino acid synthase of PEP-CTERM/exosortase system